LPELFLNAAALIASDNEDDLAEHYEENNTRMVLIYVVVHLVYLMVSALGSMQVITASLGA